MAGRKRFRSFDEFWPFYVREHSKKTTRQLHFVGTTAALGVVGAAVLLRKPRLIKWALLAGYGPAWVGHFFVEKNRPATFRYPFWSLKADLIMWSKTLTGTLDAEVERILRETEDPIDDGGKGKVGIADGANGSSDHDVIN